MLPPTYTTCAVTGLGTKVGLRQGKVNIMRRKVEGISGIPVYIAKSGKNDTILMGKNQF